jgi:NADH-quinone oxidoreductase subunit J
MLPQANTMQWIFGLLLLLSAIGVISLRKPINACLSFLFSLLLLASFYLQLSAEFIAIMQILVYAGAILVLFVFVIVLFQDAHAQIQSIKPKSRYQLLALAGLAFILAMSLFFYSLPALAIQQTNLPQGFGSAHELGKVLYLDFFFPFEAVILLFLVAIVGALYIAKKEQ